MTGYEVEFLGCKISHTDAETISEALEAAGHERGASAADVGVVNTCCITQEAEKKSRQRVRRLLAAAPDHGRVFVTGCGAANRAEQYEAIDPRVTVLAGAASLAAAAIVEAADSLAGLACVGPTRGVAPGGVGVRRARAFVKVQDGCSFHCSYCIVPSVRGEPRSRPVEAILDEVARRVQRGQREIVLTGVNIGLYRDVEQRTGLERLLLAVADVDGVARVRISSIESNHVSRRLVAAMAEHPAICPHLHVPLQSGDDAVLGAMQRHYDSARYERTIEHAREQLPGLNVTTDLIVGYPTEDDASFERTLAFAARLGFTKVHTFPYSARPGTHTAASDPVERAVKAERSARIREQADALALEHRARLVGTCDQVLVETRSSIGAGAGAGILLSEDHAGTDGAEAGDSAGAAPRRTGYTRDYSPVTFSPALPERVADGQLVDVEVTELDRGSGTLIARAIV